MTTSKSLLLSIVLLFHSFLPTIMAGKGVGQVNGKRTHPCATWKDKACECASHGCYFNVITNQCTEIRKGKKKCVKKSTLISPAERLIAIEHFLMKFTLSECPAPTVCGEDGMYLAENGDICQVLHHNHDGPCEEDEPVWNLNYGPPNETLTVYGIKYVAHSTVTVKDPANIIRVMHLIDGPCFAAENFPYDDGQLLQTVMYFYVRSAPKLQDPCIEHLIPYETAGHYEFKMFLVVPKIQHVNRVSTSFTLEPKFVQQTFIANVVNLISLYVLTVYHRLPQRKGHRKQLGHGKVGGHPMPSIKDNLTNVGEATAAKPSSPPTTHLPWRLCRSKSGALLHRGLPLAS